MLAIFSLLLVLSLSLLVTRIATIALTYTGMSRESARFQARSAFTGTGFTTSESENIVTHPVRRRIILLLMENIVTHPVRRRIILLLMLFGNAGIAAVLTSLILTFVGEETGTMLTLKLVLVISGVVTLWALASSHWVDRQLSRIIERMLSRYTRLEIRDYASLLHLAGEYKVSELHVDPQSWLTNQTLARLKLSDEGLLILGIERMNGEFIGTPRGETRLEEGDNVIIYGRDSTVAELSQRQPGIHGDVEHFQEVSKSERVREAEKRLDESSKE
ncbi:MAG: TrkA C-terminal domain-containing protein [Gammaproteobacteria bacterium]